MKATGEVMSIAPTFEEAIMKSVRGAEISLDCMNMPKAMELTDDELRGCAARLQRRAAVHGLRGAAPGRKL